MQQSFGPEQDAPTSAQSWSEQVPLLQLFRQQSVPELQGPPLAWQKEPPEQTEPSQVPPQQGRPFSHGAPDATHVPPSGSGPPSPPGWGPPSFPPPTEPLQSQAPNERITPKAARSRKALDLRIGDFFLGVRGRNFRRVIAEIIPSIFWPVENSSPCVLSAHESTKPRWQRRL